MTATNLKEAVKALNDSGLVEKKIIHVGKKMVDVEKEFTEAVEKIPDEKEKDIPDVVLNVFNELVKEENKTTEKDVPKENTKAKAGKKKAAEKAVKDNKAKVEMTKDGRKMWRKGSNCQSILDYVISCGKVGCSLGDVLQNCSFESVNKKAKLAKTLAEAENKNLVINSNGQYIFLAK